MANLEDILNTPFLEKIAKEVRRDTVRVKAADDKISHAWGACGYAAKEVVKRLIAEGVPKNRIKIYTFSDGYHTLATVGEAGFKEAWKIEPVADLGHTEEGGAKKAKLVYAPREEYWITTPPEPELVKNSYFWQ